MNYVDGTEIRLGDRIQICGSQIGIVVFSIDTDEYAKGFPRDEWIYLGKGVMVRMENGALVHIDDLNVCDITRL